MSPSATAPTEAPTASPSNLPPTSAPNTTPTSTTTPPSPATLLTLPLELRHQIYTHLFHNIHLTPSWPICDLPGQHIRHHPYTHSRLAILQTSQLLRSEALPVLTAYATLSPRSVDLHQLLAESPHRIPKVGHFTGVHLHSTLLTWGRYDALTLNTSLDSLRRISIAPLIVKVPHGNLVRLDARRELFNNATGTGMPTDSAHSAQEEQRKTLIASLFTRLDAVTTDEVLKVLSTARERKWSVTVAFEVRCLSQGKLLLVGEEESRHVCSVRDGVAAEGGVVRVEFGLVGGR